MKLRVLISILFIIATTFMALHELEHIGGAHDSSSCQICVVDNHSVSADIIDNISNEISFSYEAINTTTQYLNPHAKKTTNHSNAPPKIS